MPQPENIATETIKYKEFSTTYDELKNKANVLYTAFTEAKKETDPVMRRTKLRAIVSYKMENPTTHKKYTIKPLQGTDNKLLYLLVGVQSMIAALEAKKPLSDALLVEMQTLERNIILQRADMMQLSENVNAAIADIDASNPPSSVVSSKTRAEKDIAELQTSYDAIVLRNNEVISELTILQGEEKSPQRDTNTFSLRKKISILISDTNNILNAVKRNITKNIGDKDKTAQLKQTIVQSIDLLRQSLAESAKLLTTEAKKPAEKNPLKIVSLQEALNDMDKYHISVNPQK